MKEFKGITGRFRKEWKYLTYDSVEGYFAWTVKPIFYYEMNMWALAPEELDGDFVGLEGVFCMEFDKLPAVVEENCSNNIWSIN